MTPAHCPQRTHLEAFVDGGLSAADQLQVSSHLTECSSCTRAVDELRERSTAASATGDSSPLGSWSDPVPPVVGAEDVLPPTVALPVTTRCEQRQHPDAAGIDPDLVRLLPDRYEAMSLVARGGMGQVLRVEDRNLSRPLALKTLLPWASQNPALVQRFQREAAINGALQHPGIPPVVELGELANGLPFFSMKLIEGETLQDLLAARSSPADQLPQFVSIFEQIAQTIAYAHSRGIIHRDLKPRNIMVGAFAEVQVMDWGLAKSIDRPQELDEPELSVASEGDDATQAGTVLGTFGFMSPEQVRGEIDALDQRTDVFGLGAILCCILTGQPPYVASQQRSSRGAFSVDDLQAAYQRLDDCGADLDLVGLAKRCMASDKEDRPGEAGEVATAVAAYQQSANERAKRAELEAVRQRALAEGERKRRRVQLALAVSVLFVLTGGGWLLGREWLQRQLRNQQLEDSLSQGESLIAQLANAPLDNEADWLLALDQVAKSKLLIDSGPVDSELAARARALDEQAAAAQRDRQLLADAEKIYLMGTEQVDGSRQVWLLGQTRDEYGRAFRDYGIDVHADDTQPSANLIRAPGKRANRIDRRSQ